MSLELAPGDRYGIITFTEARPDRATNIRGGIEQWAIAMDVIIRQGCDGYMSGEAEKLKLFLDLHNIFPSEIREGLPTGWAVNLSLNGSFRFSTQTSHKPAGKPTFVDPLPQTQTQSPKYNFIITTTTSFIATVWIGVNYEGQQYIPYPLT